MPNRLLVVGNDDVNTIVRGAGHELIYGYDPSAPQYNATTIAATPVAAGLEQPLFAAAPPGDPNRLFIVEKTGRIKILDLNTGAVGPVPFLNVSAEISAAGEGGLLGLAFDPNYAQNGFFYVNLINTSGDTEIRRYQVSGNPDFANAASAQLVIAIDQPAGLSNHKAGWLGFGPDGHLYAALGDGGGGGDPFDNGQNINSLLGKMLRIDVRADAFPGDPQRNYAIPFDNPFVGVAGADEIFALGLRNPWRPGFDRGTGDLYIADVGQGAWEEIDIGIRGANYGWDIVEGPSPPGDPRFVYPIHSYAHGAGASVTGGVPYRGPGDGLHGYYFFADFVMSTLATLHFNGTSWVATSRTGQVPAGTLGNPASFGEDARGNLYVIDISSGTVHRLTPLVTSLDQGDTIMAGAGDDMVFGGGGHDVIAGEDGADHLDGGPGHDQLQGSLGNDSLYGGEGNDTLLGGGGNDTLGGDAGIDQMYGEAGDDIINADLDTDFVFGGDGADRITSGSFGIAADGEAGNDIITTGSGIDYLYGGADDDTISGGGSGDLITGNAGNDWILGGEGIDYLYGEEGNDVINGGDTADFITGMVGNDTVSGGLGSDYMWGDAGFDFFDLRQDLNAGDFDLIVDFQPATTGTVDAIVLPDGYQPFVTFVQSGDEVVGLVARGTGFYGFWVDGPSPFTVAEVQAQTLFL